MFLLRDSAPQFISYLTYIYLTSLCFDFCHSASKYILMSSNFKTNKQKPTLAGVARWIERQPANQRVTGLIPSHGPCLGCGPGLPPSRGRMRGNHILMFLSLSFSIPSRLPKNKYIKILKRTIAWTCKCVISQKC